MPFPHTLLYTCLKHLPIRISTKTLYLMQPHVMFLIISENFNLQKKLDFTLKVIGGDISTIPGLYDAIEVRITPIVC